MMRPKKIEEWSSGAWEARAQDLPEYYFEFWIFNFLGEGVACEGDLAKESATGTQWVFPQRAFSEGLQPTPRDYALSEETKEFRFKKETI